MVQLDEVTAVKFASDLPTDEAITMEYVHSQAPELPISQPMGVGSIGSYNYIFMSFIEGVSLDKAWAALSMPLKKSIQTQLGCITHRLRDIPIPPKTLLGSGDPPRCIDLRQFARICATEIANENSFNEFLTTTAENNVNDIFLKIVKSQLRTDHRMVMTHGDIQPQNIMVKQVRSDSVELTGPLDWGLSGVYPEYWEYVKAMTRLRPTSRSDCFPICQSRQWGNIPMST